ncbi:MAG: sigma-70 family RNA polymerase sigma factor [Planctomycetota bacterium]
MLAAGQGDQDAFALLVERHHRAVLDFIHRFLGLADRAMAEDLAQDVFLAAWRGARIFRPRAKVLTWLLRIAVNVSLNHQRNRRLRATIPLDSLDEPPEEGPHAGGPEAQILSRERAEQVRAALAGLPAKQRAAVVLRHYHDLSYVEIAGSLETSVSAVESLLFRAREVLRERLGVPTAPKAAQVLRPVRVQEASRRGEAT